MFANFLKYTAKAALEESCSTKKEGIEHMKYTKKFVAKNGKEIIIRNAESADGEAVLENFNLTHAETDFLLTYPDESSFTAELESRFLGRKAESANEAELVADNKRAVSLYKSLGFSEYGRNPTGFKSRTGSYQELVYMMLEL